VVLYSDEELLIFTERGDSCGISLCWKPRWNAVTRRLNLNLWKASPRSENQPLIIDTL